MLNHCTYDILHVHSNISIPPYRFLHCPVLSSRIVSHPIISLTILYYLVLSSNTNCLVSISHQDTQCSSKLVSAISSNVLCLEESVLLNHCTYDILHVHTNISIPPYRFLYCPVLSSRIVSHPIISLTILYYLVLSSNTNCLVSISHQDTQCSSKHVSAISSNVLCLEESVLLNHCTSL